MRENVTIRMQFLQQTSQVYHIVIIVTIKKHQKAISQQAVLPFLRNSKQCILHKKAKTNMFLNKNQQVSALKPTYFCTETNVFLHKNQHISAQNITCIFLHKKQHISAHKNLHISAQKATFLHKKQCVSAQKPL